MNEVWAFWHIHVKIIDIKQDQDFVSPLISPKSIVIPLQLPLSFIGQDEVCSLYK